MEQKRKLSEFSDDQLVKEFKEGRPECFDVLFDRHVKRVVCYAAVLFNDREEGRDLAQEIFLKVHQNLDSYRPMGYFKSWLFTIARRCVLDKIRQKKNPLVILDENFENLIYFEPKLQNPEDLPDFLGSLSPVSREVLLLRIVEDLPYDIIAEIIGVNEGKLRKIVFRTLNRFKEEVSLNGMPKSF